MIPPGVHPPKPRGLFPLLLGKTQGRSTGGSSWRTSRSSTSCTWPNSAKSPVSQIPLGCALSLLSEAAGPRALCLGVLLEKAEEFSIPLLKGVKASALSGFKNTTGTWFVGQSKGHVVRVEYKYRQIVLLSLGPSPSTKNLSEGIKVSTTVTKSLLKYLPAWRNAEGAWHRVLAYLQGCFKE